MSGNTRAGSGGLAGSFAAEGSGDREGSPKLQRAQLVHVALQGQVVRVALLGDCERMSGRELATAGASHPHGSCVPFMCARATSSSVKHDTFTSAAAPGAFSATQSKKHHKLRLQCIQAGHAPQHDSLQQKKTMLKTLQTLTRSLSDMTSSIRCG